MNDELSYLDVIDNIDDIVKGDMVYVISEALPLLMAVRKTGEKFDPKAFINTIVNKVGTEGTVLFPTFNWDFCKGIPFSVNDTISKTGALTTVALGMDGFARTHHPLYSFAVCGRYRDEIIALDPPNSFGPGSVFDFMHKHDGKILVIGLPMLRENTFILHVEQMVGVPFRYDKDFTGECIDEHGNKKEKTYSMYVRDLDIDPTYNDGFKPMNDIVEALNVSRSTFWNGVPFRVAEMRYLFDLLKLDIICNGARNLYKFEHPELMKGVC